MTPRASFYAAFLLLAAAGHRGFFGFVLSRPSALGADALVSLGAVGLRLAALAWALCLASAVGRVALRRFRLWFKDPVEQALFETALGLGALHHLLFALGLLGLWTPKVFIVLFLLGLYPAWRALPRPAWPRAGDHAAAVLGAVIALAALKALLASNAPVSDWDSLAVHLELPRLYARDGGFTPVTWLLHGMDAMAAGLFFVPALALGQEELAPLTMSAFAALTAAVAWRVGREQAGPLAGLAAAALFLVSPAAASVLGTPGSDFAVALWSLLSFLAAWHGRREGGAWLALSGVFMGLAATTKLSGLLLAVAALPPILYDAYLRRDRVGPLLWLGAAALTAAPWLGRAWLVTGNPVWPHFPALFGGDARELWLGERARRSVVVGLSDALGGSWPVLVPLAVVVAASWREALKDAFTLRVLAHACAFAALWVAVQAQWRYMIPLLPLLYAVAAKWTARRPALAPALALGLLPALGLGANNEAFAVFRVKPSDGRTPREAYLARAVDAWPALERANKTLPPGAKVLLYREVRGYHLQRPYLVGDPQNEVMVPYERLPGAAALHRHLLTLGLSFVLVNPSRQPFAPLPEFMAADARMAETLARHADLVDEIGGVRLYRLKPLVIESRR
ncbi:MAG: glycosyltransferase family 39 protein [Elusimicrobiota bacterium]|nr:glycosyltransferase family 39 protein [Elusimicrobiota bacterium]